MTSNQLQYNVRYIYEQFLVNTPNRYYDNGIVKIRPGHLLSMIYERIDVLEVMAEEYAK